MNLDGLTLSVLVKELESQLIPSQIQKIWQLDKTSIVLKLQTNHGSKNLVITVGSNPALYISSHILDIPKEPTSIMMFLRKHLEGARLTEISQIHGDRIVCIHTDKLELDGTITTNSIYVELMGKYSNAIFVQNGIILDSLIHVNPLMNRVRSVAPKQSYELPPNTERGSLYDFTEQEIIDLLQTFKEGTITNTIRRIFNGFGPIMMDYVLYSANLDGAQDVEALEERDFHILGATLDKLRRNLSSATGLYIYKKDTGKQFISPFALPDFMESLGATLDKSYDTISEALQSDVTLSGGIQTAHKELEKLIAHSIKKEILRHEKIELELADTSKTDLYKSYGDLLMIYSYVEKGYDTEITVQNVLVDPPCDTVIPLDPALSIVENAQSYYKLYTKLKNRVENGQYQLQQSTMRIQYLESIQYSLSLASTKEEIQAIHIECEDAGLIKKNKKPIPFKIKKDNFLHFPITDGDVYIGRNNQQNEYLTHRWAKPNDLWLHTQNMQGSHVILRSSIEPTIKMIEEAAAYAAYFSKGKDTSKVTVDYTLVKYIKKPPGSPLGYVIFSTHNDIVVEPKEPPGYASSL